MAKTARGKVWLVGAGPGDPDLISVKGVRVLSQADVVLFDALAHPALLEHCAQAELRDVGKRFGERAPDQAIITAQLIDLARAGKRVVRLKGGDPLLFARGAEEALALAQEGIEFEIVPGPTSPVAASTYAGIPLTHRDLSSSVTFITGSDREGKQWSAEAWKKLATATDTLCILMGMRRIEQIVQALLDGGRDPATPSAVIQWGARPEQRVVTAPLSLLAGVVRAHELTNPAIIVVGDVVSLREQLRWYDRRPLFGKRILIVRTGEQARRTAEEVRERGGSPITFPLIEIADPPDRAPLERALAELQTYDWVLFTSANGVERAFAALRSQGRDARSFGRCRIGAIGPKTREAIEQQGLTPDLTAKEFIGEGLAAALLEQGVPGRVLLLRALTARDALPEALSAAGVHVDVVPAYQTLDLGQAKRRELSTLITEGGVDVVMLTASSTVKAFVAALDEPARNALDSVVIACIGPVTRDTAQQLGLPAAVVAESFTLQGVLDALEQHFTLPSA
jgi:uroporphyrinogen III methyltransferase/synthase